MARSRSHLMSRYSKCPDIQKPPSGNTREQGQPGLKVIGLEPVSVPIFVFYSRDRGCRANNLSSVPTPCLVRRMTVGECRFTVAVLPQPWRLRRGLGDSVITGDDLRQARRDRGVGLGK